MRNFIRIFESKKEYKKKYKSIKKAKSKLIKIVISGRNNY